jgi:hypothetical protein
MFDRFILAFPSAGETVCGSDDMTQSLTDRLSFSQLAFNILQRETLHRGRAAPERRLSGFKGFTRAALQAR